MRVDSLERWEYVSQQLAARKYTLWQSQYGIDSPEGFIARFRCFSDATLPEVDVVTFNKDVYKAILNFPR